MRVRFFNTYEPVTSFYRDLVPGLASRGIHVDIVLSRGEYRTRRDLQKVLGESNSVRLLRMANFGLHARQGIAAKAVVTATYLVHAALYAVLAPKVDLNVFLTQPPFFNIFGLVLKKLRRQPYCCVVMDIQPELLLAAGMIEKESWLTRLLSRVSRAALRKADGVIVIGRCMDAFVRRQGVPGGRISLIPNWADERAIYPVAHTSNSFRAGQSWKDRFVVLYAGNIGFPQYFDDFLEVVGQLRDDPQIAFVVVGEGATRKQLESRAQDQRLANLFFYPFLHREYSLSEILSAGDLHLVSLKEQCSGLAVPSKTYAILAAGRPVLYQGNPTGEIWRMVADEDIGTVVSCGDPAGFKAEVLRYAEDSDLRHRQGLKARALVEGRYSRASAVERYCAVLLACAEAHHSQEPA